MKSGWDKLTVHKNNNSFRQCISAQFKPKDPKFNEGNGTDLSKSGIKADVSRISPPIPPRPSKKFLEKSKFYKGKEKADNSQSGTQSGCSYAQVSRMNIKNIMMIKNNFPNLSTKKIEEDHKVLNETKKNKPSLNMMTKRPSRKQIIFLMSSNNSEKFMVLSNKHVANINRALKDIKSDVMTDFIRADSRGLMITINKVASTSYLNTIENYIKNIDVVDSNNVMSPRLPQSKSYLKILDIPYLIEDTNILITADVVKRILQSTHIFNDIALVS